MPINAVDESQRTAARIVGFTYLAVIAPAVFAELVPASLLDYNDAAETARNIIAHERLFRMAIASNLAAFAADAILIAALYVVLKPVNRTLALLAVFWGLIETATLVVVTLDDFDVLRVLSDAAYLHVFGADRLQVLRSTAFAYLWLKSRYIPRGLAVWGIFSSLLLALCTFAFVIFPELAKVITVGYYGAPIFIFEVTMGVWLLRKGIAS
jgi:hypothetical protein